MGDELFYIDKDGKKQDAELHEELLREDDPVFQLQMTAILLNQLRREGDKKGFDILKRQYMTGIKKHGIESEVDFSPF